MRLDEIKQQYKIFVDLDGVMADFIGGMRKIFPDYDEEQYEASSKYRSKMWRTVGKHSKEGGELWYGLDLMPDAMDLWNYVKKYDHAILTATGDPIYNAEDQKRRWVAEKLGPKIEVNIARRAREKAKHAKPNHILIDDKQKAITPWEEAGGIGILHTSAADTIKQLKKLGL